MLRNLCLMMAGAAALASGPVSAATTVQAYGLSFTAAANSAVSGTAGNSALYTATAADGSTLTATVTAWNATLTNGKYVIAQAYLGRYTDGLGVTSAGTDAPAGFGCGTAGACGSQQIDNVGNTGGSASYDFLQLSFNAPVTLASFTRVSAGTANGSTSILGTANTDYDDDFSYGSGAAVADGLILSSLTSLMQTNVGNSGACGSILNGLTGCSDTSALNTAVAATQNWFIGANIASNYGGDGYVDSFKAQSLTATTSQTAAVPEASSWAMMILGFGGIGFMIRRRQSGLRHLMSH